MRVAECTNSVEPLLIGAVPQNVRSLTHRISNGSVGDLEDSGEWRMKFTGLPPISDRASWNACGPECKRFASDPASTRPGEILSEEKLLSVSGCYSMEVSFAARFCCSLSCFIASKIAFDWD